MEDFRWQGERAYIAQAVKEEIKCMITAFSGIGSARMVKERRLVGGDIAR